MNEEEKKKMEALETENAELKASNEGFIADLSGRDLKISNLEKNAQERGQQFKLFKDMSDAEKDLMSEKEQELMQRQDALESERAKDLVERAEYNKKIREATINNIATRMAKGDKDLTAQIKINLGKLNPELLDKAQTEEEMTPYVQDAFGMTGAMAGADPLRQAINTDGLPARVEGEKDYAESKEGQDIGKALNLSAFKTNQE